MKSIILSFIILLISSCSTKPQEINYGKESCNFCKMTIVDKQHASQIVSTKGKSYNFDAIECMMNYRKDNPEMKVDQYRVNDFDNPGQLLDAKNSTFLISEEIPSPMAENLSAFKNPESALNMKSQHDGELFSWEEIQHYFKIKQ